MAPQGQFQQNPAQRNMTPPGPGLSGVTQPGSANARLAFHETMELHELLNFKTVCMVKSKLMSGVVFDQDLKLLLEKDVTQSMTAAGELMVLYQAGATLQ